MLLNRTKLAALALGLSLAAASACLCDAQPYFVSPAGNDAKPGTLEEPFPPLQRAQQAAREKHRNICLRVLCAGILFGEHQRFR